MVQTKALSKIRPEDGRYQSAVDLELDNDRRLAELAGGACGIPLGVAPGTFETKRTLLYLEAILKEMGAHVFARADMAVAEANAQLLVHLEAQARQAALRSGAVAGQGGVDLSVVSQMRRRQDEARGDKDGTETDEKETT